MPLSSPNPPPPTIDLYTLTGTQDTTATFDEHDAQKKNLRAGNGQFEIETVCEVHTRSSPFSVFPIFTASIGSRDPLAPSIGFFGGIHGLERIGSQVVLDYMQSLLFRLPWEKFVSSTRCVQPSWLKPGRQLTTATRGQATTCRMTMASGFASVSLAG